MAFRLLLLFQVPIVLSQVTFWHCCQKPLIECQADQHCEEQLLFCPVSTKVPCKPVQKCVANCPTGEIWIPCRGDQCQKDRYCQGSGAACNPPGYCICGPGTFRTGDTCSRICPLLGGPGPVVPGGVTGGK